MYVRKEAVLSSMIEGTQSSLSDLLLFEQDPTADMAALSTLKAVVAAGRFYPLACLRQALDQHRQRFEGPLYDRLTTTLVRLGMRRVAA